MAETVLSLARDKLLPLLRDEVVVDLPQGIRRELEEILKQLENIQALPIAADGWDAEDHTETSKAWMKEVNFACLSIENVTERCMIYIEQMPRGRGCVTSLSKVFYYISTLRLFRQLASDIRYIKYFVGGIKERGSCHHFQQQEQRTRYDLLPKWDNSRKSSNIFDEDEVIGFEGPKDELIGWLLEGPAELSVISVVGMGGIGKTTLASTVFFNEKVIEYFDLCAWITVSPSYTVERLMRDLLEKLCKVEMKNTPQGISLDSLIDEMRNHLHGKRYAVIFDDVWSVEFWDPIESVMLDNKNGSRILITTRKKDVVYSYTRFPFKQVCELKPLNQEESMKLFLKKAFGFRNNGYCPHDLIKISYDFVEKCKGLPLAIVITGGLLALMTPSEWEEVWRSPRFGIAENRHLFDAIKVLELSYDDLPYHLKSCLLYFGIYPEDYEVKSTRLIRHWIAEGFIKGENGKTLEDIAQQYLSELIDRSLVQVSSSTIDCRAKTCRVHDLVHNMILKKIKDFSFCQHISKENESFSRDMFPRLCIATISNNLMSSGNSSTKALFCFADEKSAVTNKFVQGIPTKYRLLKVLDFENSRMHSIPKSWGNLTQLKYLSLREAWYLAGKLPKFISKLQKLEFLDIRGTDMKEMSKEICKLRKLQHLLGNDMIFSELKNGLGDMTSLQTLRHVTLTMDDDDGIELIKEMGKLTQLRNLSLTDVKEEQGSALCSSIHDMTNLKKLSINSNEDGVIDLPDIISLPQLQKLCLNGMLKKFPEWIPHLQNLVTLTLRNSKLTNDPMESLENLPHLLYLVMNRTYEGKSLHFKSGGFLQLKGLFLGPLDNLESIIIDEGALPCLSKLELCRMPEFKTVPPGIQHLRRLQVLDIFAMSNEFNECIAPEDGPENPIIQHVRRVTVTPNFGERTRFIHHSSLYYNS